MAYRLFLAVAAIGALIGLGFAVTAFIDVSPTGALETGGPLARVVDAGIIGAISGALMGAAVGLSYGLKRVFGGSTKPEVLTPGQIRRLEAAASNPRLKEETRAEALRRLRKAKETIGATADIPEHIRHLSSVSNAVVAGLSHQAILFRHELGTTPTGKAGDDWSNGFVQGYSRYMIDQAGPFEDMEVAAAVANIFEQLFGRAEGKRINSLRDLTGEREKLARNGFMAGERDARRFIESGGQAGTTGWLQYVESDRFVDLYTQAADSS